MYNFCCFPVDPVLNSPEKSSLYPKFGSTQQILSFCCCNCCCSANTTLWNKQLPSPGVETLLKFHEVKAFFNLSLCSAKAFSSVDPLSAIGPHSLISMWMTTPGKAYSLTSNNKSIMLSWYMMRSVPSLIWYKGRQLDLNAERQLYCRLYDAGIWSKVTGKFTPS